ncbi:glycerol kinase GlpK [Pseudosulfitobacter sp. SM2401]|uniref:glycerol kinase GlpK n=1 Tax=Pseudosulfitobacter sp. SM2401 TaxID=3350098 RepID=UPI0036F2B561
MSFILAIDQGTTSSRAIVFDENMQPVASGQQEFTQYFPQSGWVEHDLEEIWQSVLTTCRDALANAGIAAADLAGIGITNQRETTAIWDAETGAPLHNAIVWQDRRTAPFCEELRTAGHADEINAITGLLADPYFSGTKVKWLLDQHEGARAQAAAGKLLFGTIDSFLIWRLTGKAAHVTDATNAARTMLYDIRKGQWSTRMCDLLDVPMRMLPKVMDCAAEFGVVQAEHFGAEVPVLGVAGDQQAATIGQACFEPGMLKSTYGTGCFALLNTGDDAIASQNKLLTTVAYQFDGKATYALEGSIFVAGAVVQWLRDGLGVIVNAADTQTLADQGRGDVTLVPAFTGLGAPYWNADCRGAAYGLTRDTTPADLARAALESVGFQTRDLLDAMRADWPNAGDAVLRVDGGLSANDWAMQFLADMLGAPVDRPAGVETTALGAAWLAGMKAGIYPDADGFAAKWARDHRFAPQMDRAAKDMAYARWKRAVAATLSV